MLDSPEQLLSIASRAASRVVRNRLMIEEAAERALYLLTVAALAGMPPDQPKAWIRRVAERAACALLRSAWARTKTMDSELIAAQQAPYREPKRGADFVREQLPQHLAPHLRTVLEAAVSCNGTRAAARSCGLEPRDFRRRLGTISRRARAVLEHGPMVDAYADDAGVQFALAT